MGFEGIKKFILFCLVGGSGVVIETLIFNFFLFLGFSFYLAKFVGLFFSITFVFFINRRVTFKAHNFKITGQIKRFLVLYLCAGIVNFSISSAMHHLLGGNDLFMYGNLASFIGILSAVPITFFGSNFWVFKNKKNCEK